MNLTHTATVNRTGFTLIELSIVLVIIGLLIGGVMVGRDLIKAAELRTIISDRTLYDTAINTFKTKYNAFPGDMESATSIWGTAGGNSSDNYTDSCLNNSIIVPQGSPLTCNGNGDGMIAGAWGTQFFMIINGKEQVLVWQHLANAGLINGSYVPALSPYEGASRGPYYVPGINIPASKFNQNAGWSLVYTCINDGFFSPPLCAHILYYGNRSNTKYLSFKDFAIYPTLTAQESLNIDSKIDDGKPGTGTVRSLPNANFFNPNCTTTTNPNTSIYDATTSGLQCSLMFKASF